MKTYATQEVRFNKELGWSELWEGPRIYAESFADAKEQAKEMGFELAGLLVSED